MNPGIPGLCPIDSPTIAIPYSMGLHVRRIRTVIGLCNTKGKSSLPFEQQWNPLFLLRLGPVSQHQ